MTAKKARLKPKFNAYRIISEKLEHLARPAWRRVFKHRNDVPDLSGDDFDRLDEAIQDEALLALEDIEWEG